MGLFFVNALKTDLLASQILLVLIDSDTVIFLGTHQFQNINEQMKNSNRPYRKFLPQQKKIEELEKSSARFRRIYSEYELMSDELWNLESSDNTESIPDDFINAIKLQTTYLEDEIQDWLIDDHE